jgi:hypothetical protein
LRVFFTRAGAMLIRGRSRPLVVWPWQNDSSGLDEFGLMR